MYREKFIPLVMFCNRYVGDMDKSKDIAQECFVKFYTTDIPLNDISKIKSYLYSTAKNMCLNEIRHSKVIDEHKKDNNGKDYSHFKHTIIEVEAIDEVRKAIDQLPPKSRQVVILLMKGLKYKEIAEIMEISENTVKTQKRDAFLKLKGILKDYYVTFLYIFYFLSPINFN